MTQLSLREIEYVGTGVKAALKANQPKKALSILQDAGLDGGCEAAITAPAPLVQHDFTCSVHGERVLLPCGLPTCKFFVQHEAANNCVLAYVDHQEVASLSSDEIAYLYRQDPKVVRQQIDAVMVELRLSSLDSDADEDPDLARSFWCVETDMVCAVCGTLTDDTRINLLTTPLAFCSEDCAEAVSHAVLLLEYRLGRGIGTIIRWATHRFKSQPVLEQTLGLSGSLLSELCLQHTGRTLAAFFPAGNV